LLILIAAVLAGVHLYKTKIKPPQPVHAGVTQSEATTIPGSSEDILRERYARGEIDRPHYLEMLENLKAQSGIAFRKAAGNLPVEKIARQRYARAKSPWPSFKK